MVRSFSILRRRPVVCLTGAALLVGALVTAWLLAHRETLVPVSGTITVEGKPVQSGFVTFYPNRSKGNTHLRGAQAKIKDGRYELWTYDKKGVARKGVPPGWYRVVVEGFAASGRDAAAKSSRNSKVGGWLMVRGSAGQKEIRPAAPPGDPNDFFSNYNKPQAVEVTKAGAEDAYDLTLTKPAPKRQAARRH